MAIYNGDWFYRHLLDLDRIQMTAITDSIGAPGGSATFCPDLMAIENTWEVPILGVPMPDAAAFPFLPINVNVQNITSFTASFVGFNPGEATIAGTTTGASLGFMIKAVYNADAAANFKTSGRELLDSSWFRGDHWFKGESITARVWILKTPTGVPDMNFLGVRNGSVVATTNFSAQGTEALFPIDVSCGNGSTGSLELRICTGAGNESTVGAEGIQFGLTQFFKSDTSKRGIFLESLGVGGWSTKTWTTSELIGGLYTGQINSAAKDQYALRSRQSNIARRVYWIYLGTNDGSLTSAQTQANLETIIDQWRTAEANAGFTPPGFVLCGVPDPGPTYTTRYDGVDTACVNASARKNTAASPVMAIEMRPIVRRLGFNGVVPQSLVADGVHRTTAGAQAIMREVWKELRSGMNAARHLSLSRGSSTKPSSARRTRR